MRKIAADDGRRLHVEIVGSGAPVLCISGLSGVASIWRDAGARLIPHFRVISYDHRGLGQSEGAPGEQTMARMAADALAVLDGLELDSAHIVGHSTGGAIAQMIAIDAPARVDKLVLSGSWTRPDYRFRLMFETRLAVLEQADSAVYAALGQLFGFPDDWLNDHEAEVRGIIKSAQDADVSREVMAARIRMLLTHDRLDGLGRVAAPTLVVGAHDDALVPIAHSRALAQGIPGARLVTISGGHFFPRTEADAFARAVGEFLSDAP